MSIPRTPTTVDPGPAGSFNWKGLNWRARSGGAGGPGVSPWLESNVVRNSDGTITFRLTPQGGCEIETTRKGFGYGDYWIVTDTPLNNMGTWTVWGSLFPYDTGAQQNGSHNEIDVQETSAWGYPPPRVIPHHWGPNGEDIQYNSQFNAPNGPLCSMARWEPGKITFWSWAGLDDKAPLIKTSTTTDRVPTPRTETLHINLWQWKNAIAPKDVHVVDFAFIPRGTPSTPTTTPPTTEPKPEPVGAIVTIGDATHALAGTDIPRETDQLVIYTPKTGTHTTTNQWGAEVPVVGGKTQGGIDRQSTGGPGVAIPKDGYVLSGHGTAREWLLAQAQLGDTVTGDVPSTPAPVSPFFAPVGCTLDQLREKHNALVKHLGL